MTTLAADAATAAETPASATRTDAATDSLYKLVYLGSRETPRSCANLMLRVLQVAKPTQGAYNIGDAHRNNGVSQRTIITMALSTNRCTKLRWSTHSRKETLQLARPTTHTCTHAQTCSNDARLMVPIPELTTRAALANQIDTCT